MPAISMVTKPIAAAKSTPSVEPMLSIISRTSGGMSPWEFTKNSIMRRWNGAVARSIGTDTATETNAPTMPARNPPQAPSPSVSASDRSRCSSQAVSMPPPTIQRQQQRLPNSTIGNADKTPMKRPPKMTG